MTRNEHFTTGRVFLLVNLPLLILLIDITLEFENVIQPGEKLDFPLLITRIGRPARLGQTRHYKILPVKPKMGRGNHELNFWVCTPARNKNQPPAFIDRLMPLAKAAPLVFHQG